MPDSPNPCLTRQGAADSKFAGLADLAPKVLPVAFPLDDFYMRAGLPLPPIETVSGAEVPEPCRSLLVHNNDMTPTLAAFHASTIQLEVLSRQQRDDFYFREVVLMADGTKKAVEFGAIRINLDLFSPAARQHILQERSPLGHLLGLHAVQHFSRPKAYFRLQADAFMTRALRLSHPEILYGRRNTLLDSVQRPLAEVVEILPPVKPA
jgi:hypothetical protein